LSGKAQEIPLEAVHLEPRFLFRERTKNMLKFIRRAIRRELAIQARRQYWQNALEKGLI
jgi:hypothetical protein